MSAIVRALFEELSEDELQEFAERLRPYLAPAPTPIQEGWLRGAEQIAAYIGCPVSRVYSLSSAGRLPAQREGRSLLARRSELDRWVEQGGARRP